KEVEHRRQIPAAAARRNGEVFFNAQGMKKLALLRYPPQTIARAPVRSEAREITPTPPDAAVTDASVTHDGENERRLADPVTPEHGEAARMRKLERNAVEHDGLAVARTQIVNSEERLGRRFRHGVFRARDKPRAPAGPRRFPPACPRPECGRRP